MQKILILLLLLINFLSSKEIIINSDLDDDYIKKMLSNVKSQKEISNISRKGWYGGLGLGLNNSKSKDGESKIGSTISGDVGYGISEDFLIFLSMEIVDKTDQWFEKSSGKITETLLGIGIYYYINDNHYIKTTTGISGRTIGDDLAKQTRLSGSGFNFGYGYTLSKKESVEITYTSLSFDEFRFPWMTTTHINIDDFSEIITFAYKYRWF